MVQENEISLFPYQDPDYIGYHQPGVYFAFGDGLVKIGCTSEPNRRQQSLRTLQGNKVERFVFLPAGAFDHEQKQGWEKRLHEQFNQCRATKEWFTPEPHLLKLIELLEFFAQRYMQRERSQWLQSLKAIGYPGQRVDWSEIARSRNAG